MARATRPTTTIKITKDGRFAGEFAYDPAFQAKAGDILVVTEGLAERLTNNGSAKKTSKKESEKALDVLPLGEFQMNDPIVSQVEQRIVPSQVDKSRAEYVEPPEVVENSKQERIRKGTELPGTTTEAEVVVENVKED